MSRTGNRETLWEGEMGRPGAWGWEKTQVNVSEARGTKRHGGIQGEVLMKTVLN